MASPTARPTMPSADFCAGVRVPRGPLSLVAETRRRPPEVSSTAFAAHPPDLQHGPLMDMDFAVSCPLVRRWRLVSGFCPSTRTFDPCFFQTPPRGDALALRYDFTSIRLSKGLSPSSCRTCSAHIDIGRLSPAVPVTPPDMRVRIRRFGGLSYRQPVNLGIPSESK